MAKTSLPLEISDQDRIILDEMINDEDEEAALRAKIVLACGDNKQNNDIAEELNVTRQTISKWKEAYRKSGLAGIQIRHAGGRKSKYDDSDTLQEKIREALANHSEWTANDIAGYLNLPDYKIQYELKKMGVQLERQRSWQYKSYDPVSQWKPRLLFLYRTYESGVIIACTDSCDSLDTSRCRGVFELTNRKLHQDMNDSLTSVTLQGMLQTAHACIDDSPSNNPKPLKTYIVNTIDRWFSYLNAMDDNNSTAAFHVFAFGCNPVYRGKHILPIQYHKFDSEKDMTDAFTHWMGSLCSGHLHIQVEDFVTDLCTYGQKVKDNTPALVWYLETPSENDTEASEETAKVEYDTSLEKQLKDRNFNQDEIEEVLHVLYDLANSMPDDGTHSSALLIQKTNGKLFLKSTAQAQQMPDMDSFNFKETDGFVRDLSTLEENSESLARKVQDVSLELYLETAKKN